MADDDIFPGDFDLEDFELKALAKKRKDEHEAKSRETLSRLLERDFSELPRIHAGKELDDLTEEDQEQFFLTLVSRLRSEAPLAEPGMSETFEYRIPQRIESKKSVNLKTLIPREDHVVVLSIELFLYSAMALLIGTLIIRLFSRQG
ncbi:MAG TPA: hypothetical protein ENH55_13865 [Aurantimonas coralicida]|uniref:Uncharacterized protein n=2 Tax=root TaxID=1 RepID=A0A9C9NG92_9HYPH|nr:hypothetical protein [Aurantimonas coralicida]HEU00972.1 hypothetical protein [Aurantimonas coralicida]